MVSSFFKYKFLKTVNIIKTALLLLSAIKTLSLGNNNNFTLLAFLLITLW